MRYAAASNARLTRTTRRWGPLEARVLPAARKFKELGAAPGAEIDELKPVQTAARTLQSPDLAPLLEIVEAETLDVVTLPADAALSTRGDDSGRW